MTHWPWFVLALVGWLGFAAFAVAWNHWRCTHRHPPDPPPPADADVPDWRREHRRRQT